MTINVIRIILLSKRGGGQNYNPASFIALERREIFWKGWEMWLERTLENIQSRYLVAY